MDKFINIQIKDDLIGVTTRLLNASVIKEVIEMKDGSVRIVLMDGSIMTTPAVSKLGDKMFDHISEQLTD